MYTVEKTLINVQVPVSMRDRANAVLRRDRVTLSAYIRSCLEKVIAIDGLPFEVVPPPKDFQPLAGHLLREIEAGGPDAEALLNRLAEIAAVSK